VRVQIFFHLEDAASRHHLRKQSSSDTETTGAWIFDFPASRTEESKFKKKKKSSAVGILLQQY
jgi:hypothetical protein